MRMHVKIALASVTALMLGVAVLVVAGCGSSGGGSSSSPTPSAAVAFKFGLAGPFTGQYATYGASLKNGADIAVADLNAAGGVNGGQASYEIGDDLGDPQQAVLVAQKFIDEKSILFIDGHMFSGATLAAGPKYETAGLPMISPSATNPAISTLGKYIWRICITDAVQGADLAKYTVEQLGFKKVAIIYDDSDYGRGLADAFEAAIKADGGTVVDREQYTTGDSDFKPQLTKVKGTNPQLIFLSGYYPEGSKIAIQARSLGIKAQLLGSDGYASDQIIKLGGAAVEGMLISTFFDPSKPDPAVQKFVAAYKAKFAGAVPDYFAANSYDVIMLAAQAAKDAGTSSRQGIEGALSTMGTYTGVSGPITFDANGDVQKPLDIVMVKNGALVTAPKQPTQ
jgi:branched-chain amino acid transport system substrate-binding protein